MTIQNRNTGRRERRPGVPVPTSIPVSLFRGYSDPEPCGEIELREFLLSSTYKEQIEKIRSCPDKKLRREMKSRLPAVTASGLFSKRCNGGLLRHSGMICIDLDGQDNPGVGDWSALKYKLADFPGLYYAGLSAGGNGLFLIIHIARPERHAGHFTAISKELQDRGLIVDAACKDVARLRGASYDPQPFWNPEAATYTSILETEKSTCPEPVPPLADLTTYRIRQLIDLIECTGTNIADYYPDWYAIGCSLAAEFGEAGRGWFHVVSGQSRKYDPKECDRQYDRCLAHCSHTSIRTFFWYCKRNGLTCRLP